MLFKMAQIFNLLLIFEPNANNKPEQIIAICYTEISLHIKQFMKYKTYSLKMSLHLIWIKKKGLAIKELIS